MACMPAYLLTTVDSYPLVVHMQAFKDSLTCSGHSVAAMIIISSSSVHGTSSANHMPVSTTINHFMSVTDNKAADDADDADDNDKQQGQHACFAEFVSLSVDTT